MVASSVKKVDVILLAASFDVVLAVKSVDCGESVELTKAILDVPES